MVATDGRVDEEWFDDKGYDIDRTDNGKAVPRNHSQDQIHMQRATILTNEASVYLT